MNPLPKNKKLITCLSCISATASLLLLSLPGNAKDYRLNADYSASHSLTIMTGQNAPTSSDAYQITDSAMNLHAGGYVYARATNKRPGTTSTAGTLSFNSATALVMCAKESGSNRASAITFDLWANGIENVNIDFTDFATEYGYLSSSLFTMSAYTDGGYSSAGKTPVQSQSMAEDDCPITIGITASGVNHIRIELYSVSTSTYNSEVELNKIIVNFTC